MTEQPQSKHPSPVAIFEDIRSRAITMAQTAFMESGRAWPDAETADFIKLVLGIGIAAASEHYGEHPEHLVIASAPICTVCRETIETLQVGVDPARDQDESDIVRIAWPCGHRQSS